MRAKIGDKQRLEHIDDAIVEIDSFVTGLTPEEYAGNRMMQLACVKCLEIIGEAATHVSEQTRQLDPTIEWQKIKAFRNFSVHEYFNVSTHLVWKIIKNDLPGLKAAIRALLINLQK